MAVQDLTPQLRTRLSRLERAVGWFVLLAVALLGFGFGYYIFTTAERKGWFKTKVPYYTFINRATGLRVGDPVQLMGFGVGQITRIDAQPPESPYSVYLEFELIHPYDGYIWTEGSHAKVATADLLGKRVLEVTKGTEGHATYIYAPLRVISASAAGQPAYAKWVLAQDLYVDGTNRLAATKEPIPAPDALTSAGYTEVRIMNPDPRETRKTMTGIWNDQEGYYDHFTKQSKPYRLLPMETPAATERLEAVIGTVEKALPNFLNLTNQLAQVLSNSASLTSNLNAVAEAAQPAAKNLAEATRRLDRPGALGEWLIPTNIQSGLETTLTNAAQTLLSADVALDTANTNIAFLARELSLSLDNLASMTSNLNEQVEANTNLLTGISEAIVHADQFIQGLKRHWLLRSAFKTKQTNAAPAESREPLRAPKER